MFAHTVFVAVWPDRRSSGLYVYAAYTTWAARARRGQTRAARRE